jgi:hypothetical protein
MKRMGALLARMTIGTVVAIAPAAGETAAAPRETSPGGILVSVVAPSRCYPPDSRIQIVVRNLAPHSSVQASSDETVSVHKHASATGATTLTLLAPSALQRGRRVEAHLVEVDGTDALERPVSATTAFVFARNQACANLNRRRP